MSTQSRQRRKAAERTGVDVDFRYWMLNKPRGIVTERKSGDGQQDVPATVYDVLKGDFSTWMTPYVGRLDKESEGLLLFTDDGLLAQALIDPTKSAAKPAKIYRVLVSGLAWTTADLAWHAALPTEEGTSMKKPVPLPSEEEPAIASGPPPKRPKIEPVPAPAAMSQKGWKWHLNFGTARAQLEALRRPLKLKGDSGDAEGVVLRTLSSSEEDTMWLEFELREGKNRQIRKLCGRSGLQVHTLRRTAIGPLRLGDLPLGEARLLTSAEVLACRAACAL